MAVSAAVRAAVRAAVSAAVSMVTTGRKRTARLPEGNLTVAPREHAGAAGCRRQRAQASTFAFASCMPVSC